MLLEEVVVLLVSVVSGSAWLLSGAAGSGGLGSTALASVKQIYCFAFVNYDIFVLLCPAMFSSQIIHMYVLRN